MFIQNGLAVIAEQNPHSEIRILEIGFGTGLNALLTLQFADQSNLHIHYTTLEPYPLNPTLLAQLNYPSLLLVPKPPAHPEVSEGPVFEAPATEGQFQKLHDAPWNVPVPISNNFTLVKKLVKLEDSDLKNSQFDLIYFDAFAPAKQPEMWNLSVLNPIVLSMKPGGIFVTYCAKGQLKRDLKSLGLIVETLVGPPGKKEMVRARKT